MGCQAGSHPAPISAPWVGLSATAFRQVPLYISPLPGVSRLTSLLNSPPANFILDTGLRESNNLPGKSRKQVILTLKKLFLNPAFAYYFFYYYWATSPGPEEGFVF
jgi:uncharacterized protein (TIGR03382 family)